ncbi:MAG: thioredoxin family protein [Planctomycetota bacterium]|nr:thioredoxin family protein [Planctomycetota bacterium]
MPIVTMELGNWAPNFSAPNIDGRAVKLEDYSGKPVLVMFICNHCPFVQHIREALSTFARDYEGKDLVIIAINSNDVEAYPDDSPEKMIEEVETFSYCFPYLFDEDQSIAKAYGAMCTPDFFLFDRNKVLVYHGQFDKSRPTNDIEPNGEDLRAAVDALLAEKAPLENQAMSIGCGIKWIAGNEPWK